MAQEIWGKLQDLLSKKQHNNKWWDSTWGLSISNDEEIGVSLQFYRDQAHADQVRSKMMQDETFGAIAKEFDTLVTQGKSMIITDGFSRLGT